MTRKGNTIKVKQFRSSGETSMSSACSWTSHGMTYGTNIKITECVHTGQQWLQHSWWVHRHSSQSDSRVTRARESLASYYFPLALWLPISVLKVKVEHTRLPSVGFRSWSQFLAVSMQVTWVINPAVGCHYFPPGLQLPPQPLRGLLPILLLGEQRHNGCEQFA